MDYQRPAVHSKLVTIAPSPSLITNYLYLSLSFYLITNYLYISQFISLYASMLRWKHATPYEGWEWAITERGLGNICGYLRYARCMIFVYSADHHYERKGGWFLFSCNMQECTREKTHRTSKPKLDLVRRTPYIRVMRTPCIRTPFIRVMRTPCIRTPYIRVMRTPY